MHRRGSRVARHGATFATVLMVACGGLTVAIHAQAFPWSVQRHLRDWGLHSCALVATPLLLAIVLGHYRTDDPSRRRLLRVLACATPLAVTLLHELGQWLWPAGQRDAFDSVRDALLNVLGTAIAWCVLRWSRPAGAAERAAPRHRTSNTR